MVKEMTAFPRRVFITGTDTGIGKTVVAAILMAGLKGVYWKPIQSGLEEMSDTEWIKQNTGLPDNHFREETYRLHKPLSPHASAAKEVLRISMSAFEIPNIGEKKHLIIEGAGGVMVPLNEKHLMIDLIKKLEAPALLVSLSSLGTINHTLLSIRELRRNGIEVMGVIINGPKNRINRDAIEHYGEIDVLAEIEPLSVINSLNLKQCFADCFINGEKDE